MGDRLRHFADRTDLRPADRDHLLALVEDWTLVSDLAFADLVLWVPTWNHTGFTAMAQVRPATGPTSVPEDIVGRFVPRGRRALLDRAYQSGLVVRAEPGQSDPRVAFESIPVIVDGRSIAVIARQASNRSDQRGALEEAYLRSADDLIAMISTGEFPFAEGLSSTDAPPRVGDGLIRLDPRGVVAMASPNALSAFHRLGLAADLLGAQLSATATGLTRTPGLVDEALGLVASGRSPGAAQVENSDASVTLRSIPLKRDGQLVGALVLVRDVTDLRRRERALLTKDSTIREIHHRVKNNLQTVAALLRLQARQISEPAGRAALSDAVRRVGAIAVVHETLSTQEGDDVDFDEVADRVVALTRDLAVDVEVERTGSAGRMPAGVVTPLAMSIAELLSNAVAHGISDSDPHSRKVRLILARNERRVTVEVIDSGIGMPSDFDPAGADSGLGTRIVRTLVTEELRGSVSWEPHVPQGTRVVIDALVR
ncbi:MAG: sensor histidine kinase [Actinobacteria bacterium]|nr:sensor histidine kinase [Actinomycetota bacterium]